MAAASPAQEGEATPAGSAPGTGRAAGAEARDHRCSVASCTPCVAARFLGMMYSHFGGYVPVACLTYCLNEGFAFPTASMALKVYFLDVVGLDGPAAARHTLAIRVGWIAKPLVGMLSDVLPLFGLHRSSYLALSCVGGLLAWTFLSFCEMSARATLPFLLLAGLSLSIPDIMVDANAAELARKKPELASNVQGLNFTAFALGGLLSCSLSGPIVHHLGPRAAFMALNLSLVLLLLATVRRWLPEKRVPAAERGLDTRWLRQNWRLAALSACMSAAAVVLVALQVVLHRSVLRFEAACAFVVLVPLGFCVGMRQVSGTLAKASMFLFLHGCLQPSYPDTMFRWLMRAKDGPHFNAVVLGWTDCFGSLGLLAGVLIYTKFLARMSYRFIFAVGIVATAVPSILDVVLVKRWNLAIHIPDLAMAIGDDAFSNCVIRLFRMPVAVLAMKACPSGREGSVMSLVLSLGGFGHVLGVLFGSCLLEALGVKRGHYERLAEALALRGICRLVPLLFLPFLIPAGLSPSSDLESHSGLAGEEEEAEGEEEEKEDEGTRGAEAPRPRASDGTLDGGVEPPRGVGAAGDPDARSRPGGGEPAAGGLDMGADGDQLPTAGAGYARLVSTSSMAASEDKENEGDNNEENEIKV